VLQQVTDATQANFVIERGKISVEGGLCTFTMRCWVTSSRTWQVQMPNHQLPNLGRDMPSNAAASVGVTSAPPRATAIP
jgi:hypothetical protein